MTELAAFRNGNLFHQGLRDTHRIDRISSLVCRQHHHILHPMLNRGKKDIVGTHHIGHRSLHREELTARHLLQSRSRKHIIHPAHSHIHRSLIPHISYIELHLRRHLRIISLKMMPHVILLLLIPREDPYLPDVTSEKTTKHGITKTARTTCNQQDFIFKD